MRSPVTFNLVDQIKNYFVVADTAQLILKPFIEAHASLLNQIQFISNESDTTIRLTQCPTCKLSMESHSTSELMECCMKQVGDEFSEEEESGICQNCRHAIEDHVNKELAECTIQFLKSNTSFK